MSERGSEFVEGSIERLREMRNGKKTTKGEVC